MKLTNLLDCILCSSTNTYRLCLVDGYRYMHCRYCDVIFLDPRQRLDPAVEKSRYLTHENDPKDLAYQNFLRQLVAPLEKKLQPNSYGLDFGSGPGPALHVMFEEKGHRMSLYDPFFADNPSVFDSQYDFITSTETAEHLYHPREEFDRLWSCLKPGGFLGIMTLFVPSIDEFPDWYYRREDTHVTFYSPKTFQVLADRWGAELELIGDRVAIFHKRP